jgi:uncharacterized protein YjbJ (UPF0337 family)
MICRLGAVTTPPCLRKNHRETIMNKDQVKGRVKEVQGSAKEVAGKIVGNKKLEIEGKVQKNVGKFQAGFGDLKNSLKK